MKKASISGRIILFYSNHGFPENGGITTLARDIAKGYLSKSGVNLKVFSLSSLHDLLPEVRCTHYISLDNHVIIFGCDRISAYWTAITLRIKGIRVSWLPCFHDPRYTIHKLKAIASLAMLRLYQIIGVRVYVQTLHEKRLLSLPGLRRCTLTSHCFTEAISSRLAESNPHFLDHSERDIDVLFLGRPTVQKGWLVLNQLVDLTNLNIHAVIPYEAKSAKSGLKVHIGLSDDKVKAIIRRSKVLLLPSNYESFGLAQVESVCLGCFVPILGYWPLWAGAPPDLFWDTLSLPEIAIRLNRVCKDGLEHSLLAKAQFNFLQHLFCLSYKYYPRIHD